MESGVIASVERGRVQRREDEVLPTAWVNGGPAAARTAGRWWAPQGHAATELGEGPVLAMVGGPTSPAYRDAVEQARAGARVYVLTTRSQALPGLLAHDNVLVRRVRQLPAEALLGGSKGALWMGDGWRLTLQAKQVEAMSALFRRVFWHDAIDEAFGGGGTFRQAGARPFEVPPLPEVGVVRFVSHPEGVQQGFAATAWVYAADGRLPGRAVAKLFCAPSGSDHSTLSELSRRGAEVRWADLGLPVLVLDEAGGYAEHGGLAVSLGAAQVNEARALLSQETPWRFETGVRLGDHAETGARLLLRGESRPQEVAPDQRIELPALPVDELRLVGAAEPTRWPSPSPLTLAVHYQWRVDPPRVPKAAKEDPLVASWSRVDESFQSRVRRAQQALEEAEERGGSIAGVFARLKGAMTGFARQRRELLTELTELSAGVPSGLGTDGADGALRQLAALEERASALHADLDAAERKAREDVEREKQEAAWQAGVTRARAELTEARRRLTEAEAEVEAARAELASADTDTEEGKGKGKGGKDKKAAARLKAATRRVTSHRASVESLTARSEAEFVFEVPPEPSLRRARGRFVPAGRATQGAGPSIPEQDLPATGRLCAHAKQRYLVIERWEDLELGESEARRLGARLVAPEAS